MLRGVTRGVNANNVFQMTALMEDDSFFLNSGKMLFFFVGRHQFSSLPQKPQKSRPLICCEGKPLLTSHLTLLSYLCAGVGWEVFL